MASGNMKKLINTVAAISLLSILSGCVTQQYNDDETPIVENDASTNDMAMTRVSLGLGYLKMGNTTQAKFNLDKAKRFAPKLIQVHMAFAHYYDTVGEPEQAVTSYEEALSLDPKDANTLNNYGVFLCRQGRLAEAEQKLLKAISIPSYIKVSESYENLALCQLKEAQFSKAEEYFNKAITHSPNRASSLLQMARLQYAKADYQQAKLFMQRYEKSTRRFTANALALSYKIHQKLKSPLAAKSYGDMLVKMFPNAYESKQYLLNGLVEIDADVLAQKYQATLQPKKKKRVVVLKPQSNQMTLPVTAKKHSPKVVEEPANQSVKKPDNIAAVEAFLKKSEQKAKKEVASTAAKQSELNENQFVLPEQQHKQQMLSIPVHIVKKGDSIYNISKQYNIKMRSLFRWNKLNRQSSLRIGDVIYLANPAKAVSHE